MPHIRPAGAKGNGNENLIERRIRHITAVQVCNLTPFPVRDAFASALSQPAEQSQFTTHGHLSDDLDVTLTRKRGRRISNTSVATIRSLQSDEEEKRILDSKGRRTSVSRIMLPAGNPPSGSPTSVRVYPPPSTAAGARPHRSRTTSSGHTQPIGNASYSSQSHPGSSAIFLDNSQSSLEKVLSSRLVETFIAITVLSSPEPSPTPSPRPALEIGRTPDSPSPIREKPSARQDTSTITRNGSLGRRNAQPPQSNSVDPKRRNSVAATPRLGLSQNPTHSKSLSTSAPRANGKSLMLPKLATPAKSSPTPTSTTVPSFLSPIHRPSTNPRFAIDSFAGLDFAPGTDLTGNSLRVEVWGKVGEDSPPQSDKGKQREIVPDSSMEWKILDRWTLTLNDLVPLPDELPSSSTQLPSNTLLVTLSPPGQTFYLPAIGRRERSLSPSVGYTSDPETSLGHPVEGTRSPDGIRPDQVLDVTSISRRRPRGRLGDPESDSTPATTASWPDIFKLVTLQSCILDNESSLTKIVSEIDKLLQADDSHARLKREVAERQATLDVLHSNRAMVVKQSNELKLEIDQRQQALKLRREMLELAQEQHKAELEIAASQEQQLRDEEAQLATIHARFAPTRTTLLSTLSTIYPIDLLSPPDLLYTILDVPLPIPLSPSDPAPPLSLPSHKNVTDESVATSLGYVAQVVQLLAAYLGKGLVYPVTCIGSRSLIRDGISSMVGPRMFPLFSRGVDTYRFEYGVFLLNKDIELLMVDRDLRALDLRHTLPNLKNLLLTLTNGEGAPLRSRRSPDSPISVVSGLETPPRPGTPVDNSPSTPKASASAELPKEGNTPPASGSTTPTPIADASKRNRPFLGLAPFAGFLRSRYPSSSAPPPKPDADTADRLDNEQNSVVGNPHDPLEDDEDDRKTIHGVVPDDPPATNTPEGHHLKDGDILCLPAAQVHDRLEKAHADEPPPPRPPASVDVS